ncbi:MAG: type II secretion system protein GspL [Pseudomonadota bacterium]|nr:type II secretion system protein GspL [Pseudomonadota bacterium]
MTDTLVLFLPTDRAPYRWLRIAEGVIAERGEGMPVVDPDLDGTVGILPADAVTLHWADLPDRSAAQAVAAARLLAADASLSPPGDLHVAVGREDSAQERPIGVVSIDRMRGWLADLAAGGIDPRALVPAPMLLPRPADGYVRADLGGDSVVRGATSGFADEARLTELITGGAAPVVLGRDDIERAIVGAVAAPSLDLRQGMFARRTRRSIDWALVARLAWIGVAILTVSLFISLVQIVRLNLAASDLESSADMVARASLPSGTAVSDPPRQLTERLARLRGGGAGFSRTAATVFAVLRAVPGTELSGMAFDANGNLRVTVSGEGEGPVNALKERIERAGFAVQSSPFARAGDRVSGDLTVAPR